MDDGLIPKLWNLHISHSQLNGAQGEVTGTDDFDDMVRAANMFDQQNHVGKGKRHKARRGKGRGKPPGGQRDAPAGDAPEEEPTLEVTTTADGNWEAKHTGTEAQVMASCDVVHARMAALREDTAERADARKCIQREEMLRIKQRFEDSVKEESNSAGSLNREAEVIALKAQHMRDTRNDRMALAQMEYEVENVRLNGKAERKDPKLFETGLVSYSTYILEDEAALLDLNPLTEAWRIPKRNRDSKFAHKLGVPLTMYPLFGRSKNRGLLSHLLAAALKPFYREGMDTGTGKFSFGVPMHDCEENPLGNEVRPLAVYEEHVWARVNRKYRFLGVESKTIRDLMEDKNFLTDRSYDSYTPTVVHPWLLQIGISRLNGTTSDNVTVSAVIRNLKMEGWGDAIPAVLFHDTILVAGQIADHFDYRVKRTQKITAKVELQSK